jgi:hypothetical protein
MERRYFYGSVWAVTAAQTVLLILWKTLPSTIISTPTANWMKLIFFVAALLNMGLLAARGKLYRTRPILPGELMVSD